MRLGLLTVVLLGIATSVGAAPLDPQLLADRIDAHLASSWQAAGIEPAPLSDDAEFLRRVTLDLAGTIPRPYDVRTFLDDDGPGKRRRVIDELLAGPRHARHFANLWRQMLLPEADASQDARYFQPGFTNWLRDQFRANVSYDKLVYQLIAAPISSDAQTAQTVLAEFERPNPLAYYAVKSAQPENLAATTTRMFLGIQIECAQCHSHPFASWTQDQFWSQAAFFAGIERQGTGLFAPLTEALERHALTPTNAKETVAAAFLDAGQPQWQPRTSPRVALARWIVAPENPYFARATVNRLWGQFFGSGIVDPVDDFHDDHPPSHPALLDELAQSFVAAGFDLRLIVRALVLSRAYQRTSARTHVSQDDARQFARMPTRGLTAEQFYDSLALAIGLSLDVDQNSAARSRNSMRDRVLTQFAPQGTSSKPETSILQALTLMNGKLMTDATTFESGATLTGIAAAPLMSTSDRIEALYLAALSRLPTDWERERLVQYVNAKDPARATERLADVFWVLLNSAEFRLNH